MLPLLALFFLSGASGLAYQVLWVRELSFVFGVTSYAAATVLAAFMAGLALGAWLAGAIVTRVTRPLKAFGMVELLIALSALATPFALDAAGVVYRMAYALTPDAVAVHTLTRLVVAFLVLIVPTTLMGVTLPLLSAHHRVQGAWAPARVSALYAVNTAGAVTGVVLTGFVLIGAVGTARTLQLAAAVNVLVAIGALTLHARMRGHEAPVSERPVQTTRPRAAAVVWGVMALTGFAALALEVLWFRLMTLSLDGTTYAFTTTLAAVLVGISVGGAIGARWLRTDRDWRTRLIWVLALTTAAVLLGAGMLVWERPLGLPPIRPLQRVVLLVLPAALMMGVSFPVLLRLGVELSGAAGAVAHASVVGRLYSVNVLGAIAGSLAGGFVLVPLVGTWPSVLLLSGLYWAAALILAATHVPRRTVLARLGAVGIVYLGVVQTLPDPFDVALRRRHAPDAVEVFRHDGIQSPVSVFRQNDRLTLNVGGLHQANDSAEMVRLHRQIGVLPMVLHPDPKRVLVIGLGGGATPGAVSQFPDAEVQVVELSDSVRRAAALFSHVTYNVLQQPHVRLRVDDGRNFLALSGETFDVITADIIQPRHAGAGHLYSREYFTLVRRALRPGGLVLQWIGKREPAHYALIMRTFLEVFPEATLWRDGEMLVGSVGPLRLEGAAFARLLASPATRRVLNDAGVTSLATLREWYTAGPTEMRAFVGHGVVLTDDRPLVEYHRSLRGAAPSSDLSSIRGSADGVLPPD